MSVITSEEELDRIWDAMTDKEKAMHRDPYVPEDIIDSKLK
jgi:hypothetical protein